MNTKTINDGKFEYYIDQRLGKGSFADVYKGKVVQTQETAAVKVIDKKVLKKYGD